VAAPFQFERSVAFSPENAGEILRAIPAIPGVFALYGPPAPEGQAPAQPYLTRAADLRRRITRMLAPPKLSADGDGMPAQSKRLNLRSRVARIDYTVTGSEFESIIELYHATASLFSLAEARRRLRLRTPFFLRFTAENAYPRVYSTNRLSKRALSNLYGPFPSRAAADRYCDAVLDIFKLRRCYEDLAPYPEHPGCVYQEMKKCLAPCNQACTPEGAAAYSAEAAAVKRFFDTRGDSLLIDLGLQREEASADLDFERAARVHEQWQKVKAAQTLADELVQPIPNLRAVIVQRSAQPIKPRTPPLASEMWASAEPDPLLASEAEPSAAIFLLHAGCITGPARLSTLGVRAVKEQTSVGSSLFAQPLMLQAVALADIAQPATETVVSHLPSEMWVAGTESSSTVAATETSSAEPAPLLQFRSAAQESASPAPATETPAVSPSLSPEVRASNLIASLEAQAAGAARPDIATLSDHLSLLRRWYYRPEKQRIGEVFFAKAEGSLPNTEGGNKGAWPIRRILNGAARLCLGDPTKPIADTQRDLAVRNPADEPQTPARSKILHAGRPEVERTVPVIEKGPHRAPAFRTRRKSQPT
jgi:hypothetical protein